MNSRDKINKRRSAIAIAQALILLSMGSLICWAATTESPAYFYLALAGLFLLSISECFNVCPNCDKNISSLPNGGFLSWPKLSKEVKCCPYCREDFSAEDADETSSSS